MDTLSGCATSCGSLTLTGEAVSHADKDKETTQIEKAKKVIDKEGVPLFYIRICWVLENMLNKLSAEEKKNLKSANNKAYNTLKHKVKKNNKQYEAQIADFEKVILNIIKISFKYK